MYRLPYPYGRIVDQLRFTEISRTVRDGADCREFKERVLNSFFKRGGEIEGEGIPEEQVHQAQERKDRRYINDGAPQGKNGETPVVLV